MRTLDLDTGVTDYVAVACKSTSESQCPSCAKRARVLRMEQLREGWHLDHEPVRSNANAPSELQTELLPDRHGRPDRCILTACDEGEDAAAEEMRQEIQSVDV